MDISKRILELRFQKGIKQKDMAIILDIPQSTYSRMENNLDKLTIEQLEKIAGALGVGLLELLTGEPPAVADGGKIKELEARILELEEIREIQRKLMKYYEIQESDIKDAVKLINDVANEIEVGKDEIYTKERVVSGLRAAARSILLESAIAKAKIKIALLD